MAMLSRFFHCCNSSEAIGHLGELKVVHLSSDVLDRAAIQPVHSTPSQDSFDFGKVRSPLGSLASAGADAATPRQRVLRQRIWLPKLRRYPFLPSGSPDEPEDVRRMALLKVYQDFVMDLHKGLHMTQLNSNQEYSDIHCQILEDLQTLKIDQGSGCIIEFPLGAVSKVYRIVKNDDKWYSAGSSSGPAPMPPCPLSNAEHIVVVEFMRRKLAFVFPDVEVAQRFLLCIELLIRRAQEAQSEGNRAKLNGGKTMAPLFSVPSSREPGARFAKQMLPRSPGPSPSKDVEASGTASPTCACEPSPI